MASYEPSSHTRKVKLAPSILSADFGRLGEQVVEATRAGADYIHVDVMDGRFVPNLTLGPVVIEAIKASTHLPLDVHLMIVEPGKLLDGFIHAGADHLIIHSEACQHLHQIIQRIKGEGLKAGVAINPATSLASIEEVLPYLDVVLVLSVNPGFGGQRLIPETMGKVARLRRLLDEGGYGAELEVDGGINATTAPEAVRAGATVLVAGSAVFNMEESEFSALARLRYSVEAAMSE